MPVRNEERFVGETLRQLLEQDYPVDRYEIIVADGESTDRTAMIVRNLIDNYPQIQLLPNPGRLPSSGRNVGFRNGRGEYFLVVDGHCIIQDNKLFYHTINIFQREKVQCLGRPQPFIITENPTWQRAIAVARASKYGHSGESYIHSKKEGFVSPVSVGCAYSREVFQKIGYVDESFDAAEDVEFNYRVEQAGFKTYFSPKIAVSYFPRGNIKGLWNQLNRYGLGRAKFTLKHPEKFKFKTLIPAIFVIGTTLGLLSFLIHPLLFAIYLVVFLLYLGLIGIEAIMLRRNEPIAFSVKLFIVFLVIHFSIGVGFIKGYTREGLQRIFRHKS